MKILFVTPYVPSQVRIRPFAFIRELAARGHQVTLICLVQPAWEAQYLVEVEPYCAAIYPVFPSRLGPYVNTLSSLVSHTPLSVAYCRSEQLDQLVQYLVSKNHYDVVHTEFARAAPSTLKLSGQPKVYDAVDSLALAYRRSLSAPHVPLHQRLVSLLEWLKMRRYEPWLVEHYDRVLVSSPADSRSMKRNNPDEVAVIPNGVDTHYFQPWEGPRQEETLVFLGKMSYYVNVASVLWFYHSVLPLVRAERPHIQLKIVGRNPAAKIAALAADPNVEVTGTVDDVRPHLGSATVAICPMVSGAGIQNKMLEAMSMGTPCVSTSLACLALQTETGRDVLVADSAEGFAASILALLDHTPLRRQLGVNGRNYVENHHAWEAVGERLNGVFASLAS